MRIVINILLGLVIPIAWGLLSAWAFEWLQERYRQRRQRSVEQHDQ